MIIINHPKEVTQHAAWKARLSEMTVPHLLIETLNPVPSLKENGKETHGTEAINKFLDKYEQDIKTWNQDRCDMWFFDEE